MRARWDSRIAKNDELQLRADAIFSGLQTLFKERPGYMAVFCDSIVKKMDAILRNENTDLIDPDRNYWDTILVEWYQRKSSTERVQAQGEQRQRKTEYVATTTDRIYAQYTMEHSSVGIAIPKIRLSKVAQQRPVIKIYQSEICIYNAEFSVTGDELCLTTRSLFIPFEEMSYDFSNTPAIRVEIHYDGELLYNSAEKLYRQYILLDASGAERTPHCGTIYLFASNLQEVTFPDDTDGIYSYPYPGQLYRINLDEVSSAAIDGREVFVCASTAAQFRHHTSLRKAVSAQVIHQGVSFDIFPAPFQLFIVLPEGEKSIRYQFSIDGVRHNADAFCDGGNELEIPSENDGLCHRVRIIDLATDLVKYEFNYIVLADFNVTLNAPIYYADGSQATANISFAAKQFHYSLVLEDTSDSIIVPVSGMAWQLEELQRSPDISSVLARYHADFAPGGSEGEKLYALFLHSRLFALLRKVAHQPITVAQLRQALSEICPMTNEQVISFIAVCARAEKDGANLIKPRYHFFVRALEGAYITLASPKHLFLHRKHSFTSENNKTDAAVFEAAVCTDCGRIAIVGREEGGALRPSARKGLDDPSDFYYLKDSAEDVLIDEEDCADDATNDFVICAVCGAISTEADTKFKPLCEHSESNYRKLRKIEQHKNHVARCPACGFGSFRHFYLGSEAATAVLGTELFEQLPNEEVTITSVLKENQNFSRRSIFAGTAQPQQIRKKLMRQFLCFSDSQSEAAFFASYMERSYDEFLRRRGIWHIAEKYRNSGIEKVSVFQFVDELSRYFENNRSFAEWDAGENQDVGKLSAASRSNAWVAILNEMFNARRGTSLVSMGVLSFAYRRNAQVATAFQGDPYNLSPQDAIALLELLTQDAVFSGAIDAGKEYTLTAAEREYIFFTPSAKKLVLLRTGDSAKQSWISGWRGRKRPNGNYYPNSRLVRLTRALGISDDEADAILEDYWTNVFKAETEEFVLDANDFDICIGGTEGAKFYRCKKCGRVTPYNVKKHCASVKCAGMLEPCDPLKDSAMNHYARLYSSSHSEPLYIKEHTAQLAKDQQTRYQEAFVQKKINALSCSTTFEMGVDVGSLETVYMRDVPPSPSNYVQRAGRAGRAKHSAAFVMTYAKLSSHDFTYYDDPTAMISGKIKAPIFEIENEKILNRHIFAVALSSFFAQHKEVYAGDNQTVLLNEGGYELLKEYLNTQPENLRQLLLRSIPTKMHQRLGIADFGWINRLCGENGVLEIAVQDFRGTVAEMEKELLACRRRHDDEAAGVWSRTLRNFRCSKDDNAGKKSLIGFLVRNNVLPKYGFPVDTVELIPDINAVGRGKALQLARDLQMAIAEYAPGAEVVADGKMYVSRYIRKMPGKNADAAWEKGFYCPKCPTCGQPNFTKDPVAGSGRECVSCHTPIKRLSWRKTLEPRMGFCAEKEARPVPMHRPEHDFKTDDYYIGDPHRNLIAKQIFEVNGQALQIESTSNDSLVVIGQTDYKVCPACGYASETGIPLEHKNSRGYRCVNKEGNSAEYRLSHDFKTDVAKITFVTQEAADINVMLSVLYALLEGLSREMGIERTDIKGCLFYTSVDGCMIFSVVLYDAVAGGAGHVRRIVTADGQAFQRVLAKAISVVDNCDCDSSCYRCLRNYYNQKIHDNLNRNQASAFLHQWVGNMNPLPMETIE